MFRCQNCTAGYDFLIGMNPIKDLKKRVAPGEPMPAGECVKCGALCHEVKADENISTEDKLVKALKGLLEYAEPLTLPGEAGWPDVEAAKAALGMANKPALHTPTPWSRDEEADRTMITPEYDPCYYIGELWSDKKDPDGRYPGDGERLANADFIVKAVNSHDELLTALEGLMGLWDREDVADTWSEDFERAQAAIAKAKGE